MTRNLSWTDPNTGKSITASETLARLGIKPEEFRRESEEGTCVWLTLIPPSRKVSSKDCVTAKTSINASDELKDLLNPSISARQMSPPISGTIKKRLNRECEYFWARDLNGQDADHSRVEMLRRRWLGIRHHEDVADGDGRYREGPRQKKDSPTRFALATGRLMRFHDALARNAQGAEPRSDSANPSAGGRSGEGSPMGVGNTLPGSTKYLSDETVEQIRGRANNRRRWQRFRSPSLVS